MIRLPEPPILGVSESERILYLSFPLMYLLLSFCIYCGHCIFGNRMYIVNIINEMDCFCIFLSPLNLLCVFSCVIAQVPDFLSYIASDQVISSLFESFHCGQCKIQLGVGNMIT